MDTQNENQLYSSIWRKFNANMGALWVFCQEITKQADRLDEEKFHQLATDISDISGEDVTAIEIELKDYLPTLNDVDVLPDYRQKPEFQEMFQYMKSSDFRQRVMRWAKEQPEKAEKFATVFFRLLNEPLALGIILRRSVLILLVSYLEYFLEDLFYAYESGASTQDIPDVERKEFARTKAEKRMEGGWKKRIDNLSSLLGKTDDREFSFSRVDEILECCQRRNILVHNDGVIDADFIQRMPQSIDLSKYVPGYTLAISRDYLARVMDLFLHFGCFTHQKSWRLWTKSNPKQANQIFGQVVYSSLLQGRYSLVEQLANTSEEIDLPLGTQQGIQLNHAIALFLQARESDALHKLWSIKDASRNPWIEVADSIFRRDDTGTQLLMAKMIKANKLSNISRNWPLFKPISDQIWFTKMFKHPNRGALPKKRN